MPQTPDSVAAVSGALVFAMKDPYTRVLKFTGQGMGEDRGLGAVGFAKEGGRCVLGRTAARRRGGEMGGFPGVL